MIVTVASELEQCLVIRQWPRSRCRAGPDPGARPEAQAEGTCATVTVARAIRPTPALGTARREA